MAAARGFLERFVLFFGGGFVLSLIPLLVATFGEGDRGWFDVLYTGPLTIIAVGVAGGALLEVGAADLPHSTPGWRVGKAITLVCAAAVILGGSMLYQQYSDNDRQESRYAAGTAGVEAPPTRREVAVTSYATVVGALLAGLGSTLVASKTGT